MREARKPLSIVSLTVLSLMLSGKVGAGPELQPPVISISGIHSPTVSMDGAQLVCTVRVHNPNTVPLPVTGGIVDLQLDGVHAARGRPLKNITVPAGGAGNVDLLVDLTSNAALTWLPLFMGDAAFRLPYQVVGHVDIEQEGMGRVPFNESGSVAMTGDGLQVFPAE